jgi:hypothetical protein
VFARSRFVRKFASPEFTPYICRMCTSSSGVDLAVIDSVCGIPARKNPNVPVGVNV